jgi:crotonobetainyl-CoA:carnitine CoA-transferase CaiB-like acyl-CoA transferase
MTEKNANSTPLALSGITIADFSRVLAGPYATMLLADLGARVVKIERPGFGDESRGWGPPFDDQGRATYFQSVNRNKEGISLDLQNQFDRKKAESLILESDVVVENFGFGAMAKFGIDYQTMSKLKPNLIYCSITGFGNSDNVRDLPGYDMLVQGMSGLMSITGEPLGEPMKVGVALIDVIAGLHSVMGILAALRARDTHGIGQQVEINLFSSALSGLVNQSGAVVAAGVLPQRLGNSHPSIVPYGVFHAKDRDFILAVGNDQQFARLAAAIKLSSIQDYSSNNLRVLSRDKLELELNQIFSTKSAVDWINLLQKEDIPVGPINTIKEAVDLAREFGLNPVITIDGAASIANPITLSKSGVSYRLAPPPLK